MLKLNMLEKNLLKSALNYKIDLLLNEIDNCYDEEEKIMLNDDMIKLVSLKINMEINSLIEVNDLEKCYYSLNSYSISLHRLDTEIYDEYIKTSKYAKWVRVVELQSKINNKIKESVNNS